MKKILSILIAAVAITVAFLTTSSCDKLSTSLAGTTWTATQTYDIDEVVSYTLTFAKTDFTLKASEGIKSGSVSISFFGTYVYDDPIVTLTMDEDGVEDIMRGVRDKNTISFAPDGPVFTRVK